MFDKSDTSLKTRILNTSNRLENLLIDDFSRTLLKGALEVAGQLKNPLRLSHFSVTFRELFSHVTHELAPDEQLKKCEWFKQEGGQTYETPADDLCYQGGLSDKKLQELGVDSEGTHKSCIGVIDNLSKYTHVRPETLVEDQGKIDSFILEGMSAFVDFFEVLHSCRNEIIRAVTSEINEQALGEFTSRTIQELDELSTHTFVEYSAVEEIEITSIDATHIHFVANGTVYVTLQYGSGSDFRNGDGASLDDNYPFKITMNSKVTQFDAFEIVATEVDNSSFYE